MLNRIQAFFVSIKPRIYKKAFFVGKNQVIKFTWEGIKKFLYKLVWAIFIIVVLTSMILGGLALTQTQTQTVIIN